MNTQRSYIITFWSPFPYPYIDPCTWYFSSFFQRYGNIQCLEYREEPDRRALHLMRQSDLVVITLHQNRREFFRLFIESKLRFPNYIFLITDYVAGSAPDLKSIAFEFRISPSRLAYISYSPRMREKTNRPGAGRLPMDIRREMTRAGQMMLYALEL